MKVANKVIVEELLNNKISHIYYYCTFSFIFNIDLIILYTTNLIYLLFELYFNDESKNHIYDVTIKF